MTEQNNELRQVIAEIVEALYRISPGYVRSTPVLLEVFNESNKRKQAAYAVVLNEHRARDAERQASLDAAKAAAR